MKALIETSTDSVPSLKLSVLSQRIASEKPHRMGCVLFFTGYSGAGKSTIAEHLKFYLESTFQRTITLLDGDMVRQHLSSELGFSRMDRDTNILRMGYVAAEIAKHGGITISAAIAPYAETRAHVRKMVETNGCKFIEVHIATRLEICEKRDVKGLYRKARRGEITAFTGVSDPYEPPNNPEIYIDTEILTIDQIGQHIVDYLVQAGVLSKFQKMSEWTNR